VVLKVGGWVKHSGALDWGVGRVTGVRSDGMVVLKCGAHEKKLKQDVAEKVLVEAETPAPMVAASRRAENGTRSVKCEFCNRSPRTAQWSADRTWKILPAMFSG
jgi:hypothetical protein